MNNFIEVYDNLLHPQLVNEVEDVIFKKNIIRWEYNCNISNVPSRNNNPGLAHLLYNNLPLNKPFNDSLNSFFLQILYRLSFFKNINILNIYQSRIFLQLPSPNPHPMLEGIHQDLDFPHLVCLYYINDSDGDTLFFKDDKKTEIKRVSPKKGRIAFFDGSIPHCASTPNKTHRAVVNINFIGEPLDTIK